MEWSLAKTILLSFIANMKIDQLCFISLRIYFYYGAIKRKNENMARTEETVKKLKQNFPWLLFTKAQNLSVQFSSLKRKLFSLIEISTRHLLSRYIDTFINIVQLC